jgi:uncharacterized protein YjeT (DUF2065 family)
MHPRFYPKLWKQIASRLLKSELLSLTIDGAGCVEVLVYVA